MGKMLVPTKDGDKLLKLSSYVVIFLLGVLSIIDMVDFAVPYVILAYGLLCPFLLVYLICHYIYTRHFKLSVFSVSFVAFWVVCILSSIIGMSSIDRVGILVFNMLQFWSIAVAMDSIVDDVDSVLTSYFVILLGFSSIIIALSAFVFPNDGRLAGITPNPNALGGLCSVAACSCSWVVLKKIKKEPVFAGIAIACGLFACYGVFLTQSRAALYSVVIFYAILVFLSFFISFTDNRKLKVAFIVVLIGALIMVLGISALMLEQRGGSVLGSNGRDELFESFSQAIRGKIWLGYGGNTPALVEAFGSTTHPNTVQYINIHMMHNILLQIWVDYGVFAVILFLVIVCGLGLATFVRYVRGKSDFFSGVALALFAAVLARDMAESTILLYGGVEQFQFILVGAYLYVQQKRKIS